MSKPRYDEPLHCKWESSGGYDTDGDCGWGINFPCDDCKINGGKKDPRAKKYQEKEE